MNKFKIIYNFLSIILGFSALSACQNDICEITSTNLTNQTNLKMNKVGASKSWYDCSYAYYKTNKFFVPWGDVSTTDIPENVRKDVNPADGWAILFSTLKFEGCNVPYTDPLDELGAYIVFYNRNNALLKVFAWSDSRISNNTGFWAVSTSGDTKLFNFTDYYATPSDGESNSTFYISNFNKDLVTNGFDYGWNCFQQELSYDPNSQNEELDLQTFTLNKVKYNFKGSYRSTSKGTIITSTEKTPEAIVGIASATGDAAKKGLSNLIQKKGIKINGTLVDCAGSLLKSGIKTATATALSHIFGSLFGGTTSTNIQNLQYSTNGEVTITGESSFPAQGGIISIEGIPLNALKEPLGLWNLSTTPHFVAPRACPLKGITSGSGYNTYYYDVPGEMEISYVKNPYADVNISFNQELTYCPKHEGFDIGENGTHRIWIDHYYSKEPELEYSDSDMTVYKFYKDYGIYAQDLLPNRTLNDNAPAYDFHDANDKIVPKDLVFKIIAHYTKDGKEYFSTKSFKPTAAWDMGYGSPRPYSWQLDELKNKDYFRKLRPVK